MIQRIARSIAQRLEPFVPSDRLPVLIYGLDLAIYTILSTAGLIIEGVLFRRPCDSLIIIAVYFLNQTIGGGFHASTNLSCFLTMAVGLAFGLCICTIGWPMCFIIGVNALSILMLFSHPLVLHPNKQYLLRKTKSYKNHSRCFILTESIASIFIFISFPQISISFTTGLFFSAISRLFGKYASAI